MSVTINKPISQEKELFLAICLLAGEISSDTIRRMKSDYGESKIKNIIQFLTKKKYIMKVGYKSYYGYQLTVSGVEYLQIKQPNKYDYSMYASSTAYLYKASVRERARHSSMVLYTLAKQRIDLSNHVDDVRNIFNGYQVHIENPFFILAKSIRGISAKLTALYGSRVYGYIFTKKRVYAVYAPDKEHHLGLRQEEPINSAMMGILKSAQPPYNDNRNYEIIYMYKNYEEIIDSFTVGDRINKNVPVTKRVYEKFILKTSHIFLMENSSYSLNDIINGEISKAINEVFYESFELTEFKRTNIESIYISGYYDRDCPTAICWSLSPSVLVNTMKYYKVQLENARKGNQKSDTQIMFLCFKEQMDIVRGICNINKEIGKKILIGELSSEEVHQSIM